MAVTTQTLCVTQFSWLICATPIGESPVYRSGLIFGSEIFTLVQPFFCMNTYFLVVFGTKLHLSVSYRQCYLPVWCLEILHVLFNTFSDFSSLSPPRELAFFLNELSKNISDPLHNIGRTLLHLA